MRKKPTEKYDKFPAIPETQTKSVIQPIIDDLKRKPTTRLPSEDEVAPPNPSQPQPAELDQDPGGGYNPDGTYPQT